MGLEILNLLLSFKHIDHFTQNGIEKIDFDKKGDGKLVLILKYVNDYCAEKNMHVLSFEHVNGSPHRIILVDN